MPSFIVTTKETVDGAYLVEAGTAEEAEAKIAQAVAGTPAGDPPGCVQYAVQSVEVTGSSTYDF